MSSSPDNLAAEPCSDDQEDQGIGSTTAYMAGAPIEKANSLGREVTLLSAVMLNVGHIIGSGIFSVPGAILKSVGSAGMFLLVWILAPLFAFAGLILYTELAAMFPNRSGAEVVYLEQAYPKPRFFVPQTFAVCAILLSLSTTNAIVFAQYITHAFDIPINPTNQTALAILACTIASATVIFSTKWALKAVNVLSVLKVLSLAFVAIVGFAVLLGLTGIQDPYGNLRDLFQGSTSNPNSLATALVKANATFDGWATAFYVLAEVKSKDPVRLVSRAGYISLFLIAPLYFFTNLAYVAAVPPQEMRESGQLVAALFFRHVFGNSVVARILPFMVASSCLGNLMAVTVGQARILREIARQGLLPYPRFFASTKPFGTPLGPVLIKYFSTVLVILILPAKDAFNFLIDLASYPTLIFLAANIIGVWILRARRARAGIAPVKHRAWNSVISVYLIWAIVLLVMPWIPPEPGQGDVSFWYATYCVAGLGILLACGVYYYFWIVLLPKWGGYDLSEEVEESADGARNTHLVRRYKKDAIVVEEERPLLGS